MAATFIRSILKKVEASLRVNERFPDEHFYIERTSSLRLVLSEYARILKHSRLEVRKARLYKTLGTTPHEYFVLGVHDIESNNPANEIAFIRIDRLRMLAKGETPESGKATGSLESTRSAPLNDNVMADVVLTYPPPPHPSDSISSIPTCHFDDDQFRMARTRDALVHEDKTTEQQINFTEHADPMKLLVLASAINDAAPECGVHSQICYFFCELVGDLAVDVLCAKRDSKVDDKSSKAAGMPLAADQYKQLSEAAKKRYIEKWAEFEEDRQRFAIDLRELAEERKEAAKLRARIDFLEQARAERNGAPQRNC